MQQFRQVKCQATSTAHRDVCTEHVLMTSLPPSLPRDTTRK